MKLVIFIALIATSSILCGVNIVAFGDNGQIEKFKSKLCNGNTPLNSADFYARFASETISLENQKCVLDGNEIKGVDGMNHFETVICNNKVANYIENSDSAIILGDMVYAESKGFVYNPFSPTSPDTTSFEKTALFTTHAQKWENRLKCGWNVFKNLMKGYASVCSATTNKDAVAAKIWSSNKLHKDFMLLPGNHAYDVHSQIEFEQMLEITAQNEKSTWVGGSLGSDWKIFQDSPRLTKYQKDGVKVQLLDINTSFIGCLSPPFAKGTWAIKADDNDNTHFMKCMVLSGADRAYTKTAAQNYWKKVIDAIKSFDQDAQWKVIRSHHPPLNVEGMDMSAFWDFHLPVSTDNTAKSYDKSLLENMKTAKVHVYMASHHHSAHIMAYNYNSGKDLSKFKKGTSTATECTNGCTFTDTKNLYTRSGAAEYLYVFVIGNSGRFLDPFETDGKTRGVVVWGRGNSAGEKVCNAGTFVHKYGGANFNFSASKVEVNFFEVAAKTDTSIDIAKFELNIGTGTNAFNIETVFATKQWNTRRLKK